MKTYIRFKQHQNSTPKHKTNRTTTNSILCTSSYLNNRTLPPFSSVLGIKCGVHLCCNTCCDYIQLISVELPLLVNYARNGRIYCNLIPRIPGILQYKPNPKINIFVHFSSKYNLIKIIEIIIKSYATLQFQWSKSALY